MQPLRYMSEVASTNTFRSSKPNTLSIMPLWFSNAIEYWKPEQPPPTTPMRRPAGRGSWVAMISRTFFTALSVSRTGVGLGVTTSGVTTSGVADETVLVAMSTILLGGVSLLFQCIAQEWQESPRRLDGRGWREV